MTGSQEVGGSNPPSSTNESFILRKRAKKSLLFCVYEWKNVQSIVLNYFVMNGYKRESSWRVIKDAIMIFIMGTLWIMIINPSSTVENRK